MLQTFADGVTDGKTGLVVELFQIAGDSDFHGSLLGRSLAELHLAVLARLEWFDAETSRCSEIGFRAWAHAFAGTRSNHFPQVGSAERSPGAVAGAF